jgi:hypothetical protein
MTAKLVLSLNGTVLREHPLNRERTTIGRRPENDVHIDNLAVSGQHALVITILNDSFLEDLGSTNGTYVNGKLVKKHALQHGDVVTIGKHELRYFNEQASNFDADLEKTMIIRPGFVPGAGGRPGAAVTQGPPPVAEASRPLRIGGGSPPAAESPRAMAGGGVHGAAALATQARPQVAPVPQPLPAPVPASPGTDLMLALGRIQVLNGPAAGRTLELKKPLTTLGKPGVQVAVITRRAHGYFITQVEGPQPLVNGQAIGSQAHALAENDVIELAGIKMEFSFTA